MIGGLIAFRQLNIEAYPDPPPPMVDVATQDPGLSSEEIERHIYRADLTITTTPLDQSR